MKVTKILHKAKLGKFLEELGSQYRVVAPLQQGKETVFGDLDLAQLTIGYSGKTRFSPKEYLFPESEALFTFELSGQEETILIKEHLNEARTVIWGIRPCDLGGIQALDTVFLSDPVDPYYQARRTNTLLLGLNCNEAEKTCFCNSLAAGPFAHEGYDLIFTDLGDEFLVGVGSRAGETLIKEDADLFSDATSKHEEKARLLEEKSKGSFTTSLDIEKVKTKLPDVFNSPIWDEQASKCRICGTCCIVCPACHCFNIEDLKRSKKVVQRMRYWDCCQFSGFTQMATYNSRAGQGERWRQKIYHKFSYMPDKYSGLIGCTGCGRCIDLCQGSIDIVEVLGRVINE